MEKLWHGYRLEEGSFDGKRTIVVLPEESSGNGRLAIKTEYWDAFPFAVEVDLLKSGFTLCYIENDNRWGTPSDLKRKAEFIRYIIGKYGLSEKVVPIGMSCGGLFAIKLAAEYPELISCLYLDAPVLNYMSCPCGIGDAIPLDDGEGVKEILNALEMDSLSQLIGYREMPLDKIPSLIENKIPVVMVAGDCDSTVPYEENGKLLEKAYINSGVKIQVHIKHGCDHHPHGLENNNDIISFILNN